MSFRWLFVYSMLLFFSHLRFTQIKLFPSHLRDVLVRNKCSILGRTQPRKACWMKWDTTCLFHWASPRNNVLYQKQRGKSNQGFLVWPSTIIIIKFNNNGFTVRFGVRRRHRGSPFTLGCHQFIKLVAIQDEGEGESGCTGRACYFHLPVWDF